MDQASESNLVFLDAWDALTAGCPRRESRRGGLVEVSWGGVPVVFFNLAVASRTPTSFGEFEAAVADTCSWAAERVHPWLFAVCHETLGDLLPAVEPLMARHGLAPMMPLTGMAAQQIEGPGSERPAGAWLTEADAGCGDRVLKLNETAYQMPLGGPGTLPLEGDGWWGAPERMATVLEVESRPASCAAVVSVGGLRYVALVATDPEQQRRGYAGAAMRDVLDRSLAAGLGSRTYLHATAAGKPVYERMGYRATAEYTIYGPVGTHE